jgi:hypothetical protein
VAVVSVEPVLPLAVEFAVASCPFAVMAVAWPVAVPCVEPVPPSR